MDTSNVRSFDELLDHFELYLEKGIDVCTWLISFSDENLVRKLRKISDNPLVDLKITMMDSIARLETDNMDYNRIRLINGDEYILFDVTSPGGKPSVHRMRKKVRLREVVPFLTLAKYPLRINEIKRAEGDIEIRKSNLSLEYRGWWFDKQHSNLGYLVSGPRSGNRWVSEIEVPRAENIIFQGQAGLYKPSLSI